MANIIIINCLNFSSLHIKTAINKFDIAKYSQLLWDTAITLRVRAHVTQANTKCQIEIHHHHFVRNAIHKALAAIVRKQCTTDLCRFRGAFFSNQLATIQGPALWRRDTQSWAGNISKLLLSIIFFFTLRDKHSNPIHEAAIHQRNGAFVSNRQQESYENAPCNLWRLRSRAARRARMRIAFTRAAMDVRYSRVSPGADPEVSKCSGRGGKINWVCRVTQFCLSWQ